MIWTGGAVKGPRVVDCIMKQSDIAATLLGQLGIDHTDFLFSRNVLSTSYTYPFAYYSFNNGFCFIDSTGTTLFDADADKCVPVGDAGSASGGAAGDSASAGDSAADPAAALRLERGKAILQTLYDELAAR
jgi:hypothetical protein